MNSSYSTKPSFTLRAARVDKRRYRCVTSVTLATFRHVDVRCRTIAYFDVLVSQTSPPRREKGGVIYCAIETCALISPRCTHSPDRNFSSHSRSFIALHTCRCYILPGTGFPFSCRSHNCLLALNTAFC